jgi:transposase
MGMAPYSQDLRDRVLAAVKTGKKSQAELAETFGVSLSTVEKWWHRRRTTGQSTPQPYRAGPPRTLAECDDLIRELLAAQPDLTLDELCTRVAEKRGVVASRSMTPAPNRRCGVCRTVQRLNLPLKKSRSTIANGIRRA